MTEIKIYAFILIALITVSCGGGGGGGLGCGGGCDSVNPPPTNQVPRLLVSVETDEQLLESIRTGFKEALADNTKSGVLRETVASDSGSSYTTTYTLEKNVDEHDYVKYDGSYLYIAPTRGLDCCFIFNRARLANEEDADISTSIGKQRTIRIMSTDPETAGINQVGSIPLEDNRTVEGLYIDSSRLALIKSTGWWGRWGPVYEHFGTWSLQNVGLTIYDVGVPEEPSTNWEMEVEGGFVSSRKLGNTIHLVVRYTPEVKDLTYYPKNDEEVALNNTLINSIEIEDVLPRVTINGVEEVIMQVKDCLVTNSNHELAPDKRGFPTLTMIMAVDLANPKIMSIVCYNEPTNGIYVSENAIYLTQAEYTDEQKHKTLIHKFSLVTGTTYQGSGKVDGYLSGGSNVDFRINEFQGYLRLVTTSWTEQEEDRWDHRLYVLQKSSGEPKLETVAVLPNTTRPDPIGKPNEDLYGVRFLGEKLYLVTFERIDPLYVIDLSDPIDPQISGELEVKGFSDFLHPVNENLLLGLGADEEGLVKLELFNVESIDAPYSLGSVSLVKGADWSYSEARYNRHAFTYLSDVSDVDRFTIPVTLTYKDDEVGYLRKQQLHLFEINNKDNPSSASMTSIGFLAALDHPNGNWGGTRFRTVLHDDAVYYVNDEFVWSALWSNPYNQTGPH
jgi:uncharacterized secreted protein with C-terminal beta-propeller domain